MKLGSNCLLNPTKITVTKKKIHSLIGPRREKNCLWGFENNKGADQPAHPRRLISAFVIPFLENFISKLDTGEISILSS